MPPEQQRELEGAARHEPPADVIPRLHVARERFREGWPVSARSAGGCVDGGLGKNGVRRQQQRLLGVDADHAPRRGIPPRYGHPPDVLLAALIAAVGSATVASRRPRRRHLAGEWRGRRADARMRHVAHAPQIVTRGLNRLGRGRAMRDMRCRGAAVATAGRRQRSQPRARHGQQRFGARGRQRRAQRGRGYVDGLRRATAQPDLDGAVRE
mmetsp:Transcript_12125/g.42554  ORF Transcript_12125/g.42554 Transcript_12125/m.42554 type:complete len:211 (-) Transcript_12125:46-678(-)